MSQGPSKRRPPKLPTSGTPEPAPPPSVPSKPSSPDATEPSKLRQFLDQAASVVAVERGLGARSHIKLAAIAHSLGLSDEEFQKAMQSLQGRAEQRAPTADELAQQRRRERKFQNYVGETLSALPQGVLTASMQHMLMSTGVEQYALTPEDAERQVVDLAQKLHVRRITADEAQRHIVELVDRALAVRDSMTANVRQRIHSEASRWGLTPDQVDPLIDERVRAARRMRVSLQRRNILLISAASALAVAVLGSLGIWALWRSFPSHRASTPIASNSDAESGTAAAALSHGDKSNAHRPSPMAIVDTPTWWNEEVQLSAALAGARIPNYRDTLNTLRSPDESRRSAAYAQLFDSIGRDELTRDQRTMLAKLLASLYAFDPAESCAAAIRQGLIASASGPADDLSDNMLPWDVALWAGDGISAALLHENVPVARSRALAADFQRTFQTSLELETPARLNTQVDAAVAGRLYETLAKQAQAQPELAVDIHLRLLPLIDGLLDAAARDRLQTDYLAAVLPALGDRWVIYEDLIRRSVYSDDPLNVLKMLELCERSTDLALQGYLATQLTLRTGLPRTARTIPELVAAVREALGATAAVRPLDTKERLAQWREAATAALDKPPAEGLDTTAALQQLVELTRLSSLGSALAQGELGSAEFEALWRDPPPMLKASHEESPTRGGPRLSTTQFKDLSRSTTALRGYSRLSKLQRMNYIRALKHYEDSLPDVLPAHGQDIAIYLTAAKAVDEHEMLMTLVDGILEWKMVRLGLADALADSRLREEHLLQLVSKALKREVKEELGWRDQARTALLADVARELDAAASLTGEAEGVEHQASRLVAGYLRSQAKLAGVKENELKAANSPSDLLELLASAAGAKLSSSSSPIARQLAEQLPQQLTTIDYLAANDMARMALLQRLLVKFAAAEIESGNPSGVVRLATTQTELTNADTRADHVLDQLLAGQRALLKLWLLRNE